MVLFTFRCMFWGTRTGTFCVFVYLLFLGNLLGESGRIIHRWKGLEEEIVALLESKETVQKRRSNSENKFVKMDLRGGLTLEVCLGLLEGWNCDVRMPRMFP